MGLIDAAIKGDNVFIPKDDQHAVQMVPQVGKLTVFNIGGNKARLIAAIHDICHRIYIRHGLTHPEYNKGKWKET